LFKTHQLLTAALLKIRLQRRCAL